VQFDNGVLEPDRLEDFFVFSGVGGFMVLIKVQYDGYNRQFTPLNGQSLKLLEDGETYVLIADVSVEDIKSPDAATDSSFLGGRAQEPVRDETEVSLLAFHQI
jgi:hypothetical protein